MAWILIKFRKEALKAYLKCQEKEEGLRRGPHSSPDGDKNFPINKIAKEKKGNEFEKKNWYDK